MNAMEYRVLDRAVEDGVAHGYRRAFKYADTPSEEALCLAIHSAVMNEICEWFDFNHDNEPKGDAL
jgi:hypothetical protein